jgi:hypothetical protein
MTGPEFLVRCESGIEQLALLYAHSPGDRVKVSLDRVLGGIEAGWQELFKGVATPEDIAEVVAEIGERIQECRHEIEAGGAGTA